MKLQRSLAGLATGIVFGVGLAVSQMANPEKVLAFLNLAGQWDASLLLVMGGASFVAFVGYRLAMKSHPLFADRYSLPTAAHIDQRLIIGAGLFGLGWGLAGYCPGPAIAGLGSGSSEPWIFVIAMLVGSQLGGLFLSRGARSTEPGTPGSS